MRGTLLLLIASCGIAACSTPGAPIRTYQPAVGSNEVLSGPIAAAPGHSLVVGDLVMPAGGTIPRHYHAGEEFLYVMGGSAVVSRPGVPDITLTAGQGIRIPPGTVHWGSAGPEGVRAISSWVKVDAQPLRTPVPE
jgi:quercetin dioxygenase-like cupin family protein